MNGGLINIYRINLPENNEINTNQSTPDLARIERFREDRKKQLSIWEEYDKLQSISNNQVKNTRKVKFNQRVIFLEATSRDDLDEVERLLESGVDPNVKNEDGLTALHQCCIDNTIEMCKLLLRYNTDVNASDNELWTPLHAAAACDHKEMCMILIQNGAYLLAMNVDGNMPYDLCSDDETLVYVESEMAKLNITQEQIDELRLKPEREMLNGITQHVLKKENLDELDIQGAALLHIACACGYAEVAQYLLQAGANPELPDKEGWLPIHIAACWGQVEIIEKLVAFGADMTSKTKSGRTVFTICDSLEMHDRFNDIWEQRETLRSNFNITKLGFTSPRESAFRRSSSLVRRTSMRDKHKLSRMEAKMEKEMKNTVEVNTIQEEKIPGISKTIKFQEDPKVESDFKQPQKNDLTSSDDQDSEISLSESTTESTLETNLENCEKKNLASDINKQIKSLKQISVSLSTEKSLQKFDKCNSPHLPLDQTITLTTAKASPVKCPIINDDKDSSSQQELLKSYGVLNDHTPNETSPISTVLTNSTELSQPQRYKHMVRPQRPIKKQNSNVIESPSLTYVNSHSAPVNTIKTESRNSYNSTTHIISSPDDANMKKSNKFRCCIMI